jgi:AraC-like DNA-binding protein
MRRLYGWGADRQRRGMSTAPRRWPLPQRGGTAAFSHLERTSERVAPHAHRDHQLLVPIAGRPELRVGEKRIALAAPGAALVWAGTSHDLECPRGQIELVTLQVHPRALAEAARLAGTQVEAPAGGVLELARVSPLLRELVHQLIAHRDALESGGSPPALAALAYPYFCLALVDRIAREQVEARPMAEVLEVSTFASEYVERAVLWMRANLGASFRLSELARRVGTSPRNLAREFAKELGISPVKYLTRLRIDAAAKRLAQSRVAVKEIAFEVGYASVPRFNHAFRAVTGRTPLEVRKAAGR